MQTKTYFLFLLFVLMGLYTGFAQVGIGTTTPEATAALDISSTDKGVLVPRMLESERVLIGDPDNNGPGPATGLLVYQTDGIEGFYFYDGNGWSLLGLANEKWAFNANGLYATQPDNIGIRTDNPTSALQIGDLSNSTDEYLTLAGSGGNISKTGIKMQHFNDSYGFTIESNDNLSTQGLNFLRHVNDVEGESAMFIGVAPGHIGIGTTTPKTTFQVQGKPESTTTADGVQVPVLTLAQLEAKVTAYGPDQNGAIVYIDDIAGSGSGNTATANISTAGYYYYDAANLSWQAMSGGTPGETRTLQTDLLLTSTLCNCTSLPPAMIQSLLNNGYTNQDLIEFQIPTSDLLTSGLTVDDLLMAGSSVEDLLGAGVSVQDLLTAGVSLQDLIAANASIQELLTLGFSVQDLLTAGASLQNLIAADVSIQDLLDANQTPLALFNAGAILGSLYGKTYEGGLIFFVDTTNAYPFEGLVAAASDQSTDAEWGCSGTNLNGSDPNVVPELEDIGDGQANTTAIVNSCSQSGIAAKLCDDLTLNGYNDWFLPSKDELFSMLIQIGLGPSGSGPNIGNFADAYWSSTEESSGTAWELNFTNGIGGTRSKDSSLSVRAVRAF
jgi:hypothetical protein